MRGFEHQSDKSSAQKRKTVYILLLILLRAQIKRAVLKDGLYNPVAFHLLFLRSRNLWHEYENVIFAIFIEDRLMFWKFHGLAFKPTPCVTLGFHAVGGFIPNEIYLKFKNWNLCIVTEDW